MDIVDVDELLKDDSFCLIEERGQDDVTNILQQWKNNVNTQGAKLDTRTFTRPKRKPMHNSFENSTTSGLNDLSPKLPTITSNGGSSNGIDLQIGGLVTNISTGKTQQPTTIATIKNSIQDISPPFSINSLSMDFSLDQLNNSLITSADFTNVSFFKTTNDDLIMGTSCNNFLNGSSNNTITTVITPNGDPPSNTNNLLTLTTSTNHKNNFNGIINKLSELSLSGDSTLIKDSNIAQIDEISYPNDTDTMCDSLNSSSKLTTTSMSSTSTTATAAATTENAHDNDSDAHTESSLSTISVNNKISSDLCKNGVYNSTGTINSKEDEMIDNEDELIDNITFGQMDRTRTICSELPLPQIDENLLNITVNLNITHTKLNGNICDVGNGIDDVVGDADGEKNDPVNKTFPINNVNINQTFPANSQDINKEKKYQETFICNGGAEAKENVAIELDLDDISEPLIDDTLESSNIQNGMIETPEKWGNQTINYMSTPFRPNNTIEDLTHHLSPIQSLIETPPSSTSASKRTSINVSRLSNKKLLERENMSAAKNSSKLFNDDSLEKNDEELDEFLKDFETYKALEESNKMRQSLDSIKKRHSLIVAADNQSSKSLTSVTTANKLSTSPLPSSSERLLTRRSRLYDDVPLDSIQNSNKFTKEKDSLKEKSDENDEKNSAIASQNAENNSPPQLNPDRFKTIRIIKRAEDKRIGIDSLNQIAQNSSEQNELSCKSSDNNNTGDKHDQNLKDDPNATIILKENGTGSGIGRIKAISKPSFGINRQSELNSESSSDKEVNTIVRRSNLRCPMQYADKAKAKSYQNLTSQFGLNSARSNLQQPQSLLQQGIASRGDKTNVEQLGKYSRSTPANLPANKLKEKNDTFKAPAVGSHVRASNNRRSGLVRPSSGFYSYHPPKAKGDGESSQHSSSNSLSSVSSKGSIQEYHNRKYPGEQQQQQQQLSSGDDCNEKSQQQDNEKLTQRRSRIATATNIKSSIPKPSSFKPIKKSILPLPSNIARR